MSFDKTSIDIYLIMLFDFVECSFIEKTSKSKWSSEQTKKVQKTLTKALTMK